MLLLEDCLRELQFQIFLLIHNIIIYFFHDTDDNILYRLHSGGNVNIDLTGNIANREIAGNVSGSSTSTGSFGRLEVANLSATTVDLTGDITFDDVTASGNIVSTGANKVISGSSTSTGSFGMGLFADRVGVGTTAPATIFSYQ